MCHKSIKKYINILKMPIKDRLGELQKASKYLKVNIQLTLNLFAAVCFRLWLKFFEMFQKKLVSLRKCKKNHYNAIYICMEFVWPVRYYVPHHVILEFLSYLFKFGKVKRCPTVLGKESRGVKKAPRCRGARDRAYTESF